MSRRIWILAAVALFALLAWGAKEFVMPRAYNAKTYPARDEHPTEKVTIAADPYDLPDKASIFTINYAENGFLPVLIVITNDSDQPIALNNMKVQMTLRDRTKLIASNGDDVIRSITHLKQNTVSPNPLPFPKKSRGGIPKGALDELNQAQFQAKAVEPHGTQAGFMFFEVGFLKNPVAGATLYLTGIRNNSGSDLMYFEIPLEKYLTYTPPEHKD